jgi:hypothetical protein
MFTGCILDDLVGEEISFIINSFRIFDNNGFPAISIDFRTTGKIILELFDTDNICIDRDYFYSYDIAVLNMASYKQTLKIGEYKLKVYDGDSNIIFKEKIHINDVNITIINCNQENWEGNDGTLLISLNFIIRNKGNFPIYPYSLNIDTGSASIESYVLPCAIRSNSTSHVYCMSKIDRSLIRDTYNITIKDIDNNILISESYNYEKNNFNSMKYEFNGKIFYLPDLGFLYDYYKNLERIKENDYSFYVFDRYDECYLEFFIEQLIYTKYKNSDNFYSKSDSEKINFIASFVQDLQYKSDITEDNSIDYPYYPVETLFERGGDCEDKAIFTANLLLILGYNVSLLRLPNHMAVGINLSEELTKFKYFINGYYFLETTTLGNNVGYIPKDYRSLSNISVYPLIPRPYIIHNWENGIISIYQNTGQGDIVKVTSYIENLGNKTADSVIFEGVFVIQGDIEINTESKIIENIEPFQKKKATLTLLIPRDYDSKFKTRIYYNNKIVDEKESLSNFSYN